MQTDEEKREAMQTRTSSAIVTLAGIWLIVSPFFLSYNSGGVKWNQFAFGIAITALGLIRYFDLRAMWASWLSALFGLWMVIAPFVIGNASTAAHWSSVIAGLIVLILSLAITNQSTQTRMHPGHPAM